MPTYTAMSFGNLTGMETATEKWGGVGGEVFNDHSSNFDKIITIFHLIITMKSSNV